MVFADMSHESSAGSTALWCRCRDLALSSTTIGLQHSCRDCSFTVYYRYYLASFTKLTVVGSNTYSRGKLSAELHPSGCELAARIYKFLLDCDEYASTRMGGSFICNFDRSLTTAIGRLVTWWIDDFVFCCRLVYGRWSTAGSARDSCKKESASTVKCIHSGWLMIITRQQYLQLAGDAAVFMTAVWWARLMIFLGNLLRHICRVRFETFTPSTIVRDIVNLSWP